MVQNGFPIDEPLIDGGITILMHIAAIGSAEAIGLILQLNPDINARDQLGRTALHHSCKKGNLQTTQVLLDTGDECDVDAVSYSGISPLMCAIESGNIELVIHCLRAQFNPFLKDAFDRSALDYAKNF